MAIPPPPAPTRVLRRSNDDRIVAGVCGGLGRYLGVDPVLLRVAFVVLAVAGGSGVLLYVVCWLVIPRERPGEVVGPSRPRAGNTGLEVIAGTALVAIGTILLIDRFVSWFDKIIGPAVLIAVGIAVIVWGTRR